jgi:AraC-like DNA-binding protein
MAEPRVKVEQRGSDSPYVAHVTQVTFEDDWTGVTTPDGCWDLVVLDIEGGIRVLQTGVITRPVELAYKAGDRFLQIAFKPGVFMPRLPGDRMVDRGIFRPTDSRSSFLVDRERLRIPTYDDAEGLVDRLVRSELVVRDGLVEAAIAGTLRTDALRTVQRHFRRAVGLTADALRQIERARRAVELLEQGRPTVDVAFDLGYADQPHMTRSLKRFMGRTPGEIASGSRSS